ncbi:MAG: glycosyl hydrolase 115 family protein [Roseburia sp.]|nr:glycosyl hydrolase 115 family protein [Roseburia sp.]
MILAQRKKAIPFLVEETAYPGVKKIAEKVALDVEKVSGARPSLIQTVPLESSEVVFAATLGNSPLMEQLTLAGKLDTAALAGKREVFSLQLIEKPFEGVEQALVICGSDKLGTIYGLFALSEYIGVSPMCYWGDAEPLERERLVLSEDIEQISKEPSVRYRGFFINDEWPCFGNWTFEHFGGFTAEMYDYVFEFLLRMKGNYMWPAMWTSSFPLDGPGALSEELADMYGITIAYSHHEPCLRASEEWDKVKGKDSPYGEEWNFYTNKEGLTNYWADALKRSGGYKHMVTIGMRGERDSSMLGRDAALKDNIDLLKDVISTQRRLIREHVNEDVDSVPQLLALYKEVEAYFYGDENTPGLKDWQELQNVIFMLCEDNFGHMRTLPAADIRDHKGGFGMYYHLDYHGAPVSYEWMPSTTMALIWEQMTEAYDYGIRDVWIVNVGDLKGNEVALHYFLTMAYDFDTWGSGAPDSWQKFIRQWAVRVFPGETSGVQEEIARIYTDFVRMNAMRKPETLHEGVYHPCHYYETDRMLMLAADIEKRNEAVYQALSGDAKLACYSMIYYPAKASINLLRMHLYAGKNAHYARQGRKAANRYGELTAECIEEDKRLSAQFGAFRDGKWKGMELEKHVGFTKWNDDGWRYPVRVYVEPVTEPRMSVSRADEEWVAVKNYGAPQCIRVHDFMSMGCDSVTLEISNDGIGSFRYTVRAENGEIPQWLGVSSLEGETRELTRLILTCDRTMLAQTICDSCKGHGNGCAGTSVQCVRLIISDGDTAVAVEVKAQNPEINQLPVMTFLPSDGVIVMEAPHYMSAKAAGGGAFTLLEHYGRSGGGMKALPSTLDFTMEQERPELTYSFCIPKAGAYRVELWSSPVNSVQNRRPLNVAVGVGGGQARKLEILSENYQGGDYNDARWCKGVLDQIRITDTVFDFEEGVQHLTIGALEAGLVLERILIYPEDRKLKPSYLGPLESYYKQ